MRVSCISGYLLENYIDFFEVFLRAPKVNLSQYLKHILDLAFDKSNFQIWWKYVSVFIIYGDMEIKMYFDWP